MEYIGQLNSAAFSKNHDRELASFATNGERMDSILYSFLFIFVGKDTMISMKIFSISQEHGLITSRALIAFENFPVGSLLQIIPNHSCLTAALFPRYHVVEGDQVVDEWRPMRGW